MAETDRKWALANALMTALNERKADPELMAIAEALAKECGYVPELGESSHAKV